MIKLERRASRYYKGLKSFNDFCCYWNENNSNIGHIWEEKKERIGWSRFRSNKSKNCSSNVISDSLYGFENI
ncbi:hypothetical protein BLOT_003393 [Blomia tropicalis]|nr:hypothetical protein BLOT_003393 [Blomia tropicalis]